LTRTDTPRKNPYRTVSQGNAPPTQTPTAPEPKTRTEGRPFQKGDDALRFPRMRNEKPIANIAAVHGSGIVASPNKSVLSITPEMYSALTPHP
jgi:hypothetical protein